MTADLHYLSLAEASRRLGAREISSAELTRALLDRIARVDGRLKSYATITAERALADAMLADGEIAAGKRRGPLHGVPVAVKDLCNTAGIATAAGMAIHRDHMPDKDATVVARLRAAGAVILGKLQMTEGAFGAHHPSIPAPLNPWNETYWTGSSSSGSGAATAAGLCFASLGSDTGGSIRFPSTMCGLSGLKPSWGRVSRAGVFPLAPSLDHIGPMARSALDAALMLAVLAGLDPEDQTTSPVPVPDYVASIDRGVRGLRIGVPTNLIGMDADSRAALNGAIAVLAAAGGSTVDVVLPSLDEATVQWLSLCGVEAALAHEKTYPSRAAEYGPVLAGLLDIGRKLSALDLARLQLGRARVTGELNRLMDTIDLLLMPVMGIAAPTIAGVASRTSETVATRLRYTAPFDMSGHPTLTLPGGFTADGMPAGFQIVGRAFDEATILAAGHAYQCATGWHLKRPPV